MWTSVILHAGDIHDTTVLDGSTLGVGPVPAGSRSLLMHLETPEDERHTAGYSARLCTTVQLDLAHHQGTLHTAPLDALTTSEQRQLHA